MNNMNNFVECKHTQKARNNSQINDKIDGKINSQTIGKHSQENIVAIYGDTLFMLDSTHSKIPRINANPKYRMPFCHQSVFVKTELLKKHKFNTRFKICADNELFTKIYNKGGRFLYVPLLVSRYDANGISAKPSLAFLKEEFAIARNINPFYALTLLPKFLIMRLKYALKSLLPKPLRFYLQSRYNAKKPIRNAEK